MTIEAVIALCLSLNVCDKPTLAALEEIVPPEPVVEEHEHVHEIPVTVGVEQWRPLVAKYFAPGSVDRALCLMGHESGGDPNAYNPSSAASGLMQHLRKYWDDRSRKAGWAGADIFDPEANIAVAAWLQRTGGWGHWAPYQGGLCR